MRDMGSLSVLTPPTPHTILHPHNTETETEDLASPLRPSMASRTTKWRLSLLLWDWRAPAGRRNTLFSEQRDDNIDKVRPRPQHPSFSKIQLRERERKKPSRSLSCPV